MTALRVLLEDPDLGSGLEGRRREAAERACLARAVVLSAGDWDAGLDADDVERSGFGFLVLSGTLCRRVGQRQHYGAELLGRGDLLRPWDRVGDWASIPTAWDMQVIQPARMAVLGAEFARRAAAYPEIAAALVSRALARARYLAIMAAIVSQPRVQTRVHMLFWHLADRFGRVDGDSVELDLPLTHALLGELVAATRPTVTTALSGLRERKILLRQGHKWSLSGPAPGEYQFLRHESTSKIGLAGSPPSDERVESAS